MIRHIVLVRFPPAVDPAARSDVMAGLEALRETVPGLRAYAGGENISPEGLSAGFTHAFTMDFADEAARDAYLIHPAHVAAATKLVAAADREGGILVVDLRLP